MKNQTDLNLMDIQERTCEGNLVRLKKPQAMHVQTIGTPQLSLSNSLATIYNICVFVICVLIICVLCRSHVG